MHFHTNKYTFIQIKKDLCKDKTERVFVKYLKLLTGVLGLQLKDYRKYSAVSVRLILSSYFQEEYMTG